MGDEEGSKKLAVKKKTTNVLALQKEIKVMSASIAEHAEVLNDLKGLPAQIKEMAELMRGQDNDGMYSDTTSESGGRNETDPITALFSKTGEGADCPNSSQDESLLNILNSTQLENEYGPAINDDVAASVMRLFTQKQPKETLDKFRQGCKIPENCKGIGVARVNTEIWNVLNPKLKQVDFAYQSIQHSVSSASVIITHLAEKWFKTDVNKFSKEARDDLLRMSLESLTVLGTVTQDINYKRKQELKPALSREVMSICSNSTTTEQLFGDNLSEQLKNAKSTANAIRSSVGKSLFVRNRPAPYKTTFNANRNLNWRSPSQFQRGGQYNRMNRGRRSFQPQFPRLTNPQ